jgi:hypothetical protein
MSRKSGKRTQKGKRGREFPMPKRGNFSQDPRKLGRTRPDRGNR